MSNIPLRRQEKCFGQAQLPTEACSEVLQPPGVPNETRQSQKTLPAKHLNEKQIVE